MKILALGTFDTILGMDWLEKHSPMTVDWRNKRIDIPTPKGIACLKGHEATSSTCFVINSLQLQSLCKTGAISHVVYLTAAQIADDATGTVPICIQEVVAEFAEVFGEPVGLPPHRDCDHIIPLIPGAQPVNIRPYRHKPDRKDEIEKQVAEFLRSGIIQRSTNPFSSPVILVKKDGT